jgi:osmoprotectant transport system ATP-binding protein
VIDAPAASGGAQRRRTRITFDGVSKVYPDGTQAVGHLDLEVYDQDLLVLVGPSGCGKSTTMRMVNRLVEPSAGRVLLDGTDVAHVDPVNLRRGIGYVIQNVGLFPHRTVAQNVGTVPALLGWDRGRTQARVGELLDLVGLPADVYGRRYPHELSGGERQRVGVARALAAEPRVLLMDEPFGAVDPVGRRRLQDEFRRLQHQLQPTVMFVTHDIDEAVLLGDRVVVLSRGGTLEQVADPVTLLTRPATEFVRAFVGHGSAIRLLALTTVEQADLDPVRDPSPAWAPPVEGGVVRLGMTLGEAFGALAADPSGRLPVLGGDREVVGELTPGVIHRALRRAYPRPAEVHR